MEPLLSRLLMVFAVIRAALRGAIKFQNLISDVAKDTIKSFKRGMMLTVGIVPSSYAAAPRRRGSGNVDEGAGFVGLPPIAGDGDEHGRFQPRTYLPFPREFTFRLGGDGES
jgi:hypothetical protein